MTQQPILWERQVGAYCCSTNGQYRIAPYYGGAIDPQHWRVAFHPTGRMYDTHIELLEMECASIEEAKQKAQEHRDRSKA